MSGAPMTAGATRRPARGTTGHQDMTDDNTERGGEKRGVLGTGRAQKLDTTKDAAADADATDDTDEQDSDEGGA